MSQQRPGGASPDNQREQHADQQQEEPADPHRERHADHQQEEPADHRVEAGATAPRGRSRVATVVAAVGLVISLAGWGWFATEQAREGWWAFGQHAAVGPDDRGWATIDTLGVRLEQVATLSEVDEEQPPAGFQFLALDFAVDATSPAELSSCDVEVRDEQGRLFLAGEEVPRTDRHDSSLTCGTSDPSEEPVPTHQSVLVLVPVDAELVSVRVDGREFPPATFLELPLPS